MRRRAIHAAPFFGIYWCRKGVFAWPDGCCRCCWSWRCACRRARRARRPPPAAGPPRPRAPPPAPAAGPPPPGAPRRGRWRTATPSEGCSRFWLSAPTRSGPLRPDQSGHRATFRPLLPSGHFSASVCCSAAGASPPSGPPALRRCPAASARPQPRNLTTPQPRNPATTQPRSLRNPSATQKGPSPRGESPFASGWRRAPIRGTRAGYRLQRPNRRRRPRWDPWRASAGSCSGPPSAPQSARRGQPSEPPKHRPNQSAG